ncbi:E3 ubiquitin-protein ligase ATL15-like [Nicotiana sylvestris]|uniref:RING-type E3 ubiquitin transferase n=1 Tax=Nicotiana sylvestris TaxID=4096 RepID=A0A1U7Y5L7_NICSY|nr:PREDICTED: RING-H2 finger protein ATL11-like [Nicotiana sylvestris]
MKKIINELSHGFCVIFLRLFIFVACAAAQTAETAPKPPYSFDRNIKINPPMAIILVTLISVFFAMGIVSVYVRQCAERRFANDFVHVDENSLRGAARGIDPNVINSFPMFLYSDVKDLKIGTSALECAVCLNEFEDDETLRLLPTCCHVFHPDCIDAWLISHITCPVCRANLLSKPGDEKITVLGHYPINSESPDLEFGNLVHEVNDSVIDINVASPEVINIAQTPVHNRPPRSTQKRQKITGKFPRSHSTGHSLIQPGQDCERFTLRLPEEVRNKLINSGLSRAQSNSPFPRERSVRNGYRSSSVGTGSARINHGYYERFNEEGRADRWGFLNVPPFFSRGGSTRSSKDGNGGAGDDITAVNKNLFKTVKLPFDRIFEKDSTGERSFNKLRLGSSSN